MFIFLLSSLFIRLKPHRQALCISLVFLNLSCAPTPPSSQEDFACEAPAVAASNKIQTSLSLDEIPTQTVFTVVVRDECDTAGPILSRIPNRFTGKTPSGVRSYQWKTPYRMAKMELEQWAEADGCVALLDQDSAQDTNDQSQQDGWIEAEPLALPSDPLVSSQRHLQAIGASSAYDIFYNSRTGIRRDVVIAVIDSGVLINHQDLSRNIWVNTDEIPGNGRDDDRNGYIDDVNGFNFASRIASPNPQRTTANSSWQWAHGTRVAGLAAAVSGNGVGGTGVAGRAKIMALNNMGTGATMAQANTANAIRYAVDNGAHVINLSLGGFTAAGSDYVNALRYAVSRGVVVLAAAGNESTQISRSYSAAGVASSLAGLISIGNFQADNFLKSTSSNYSTTYVELGAPGTLTMGQGLPTTTPESTVSYGKFSGTSAATPVASGAAALAVGLLRSRGYAVSAGMIERLLLESARKTTTLRSYFQNGNALDLAQLAKLINQRYPYQEDKAPLPDRKPGDPGIACPD